MSSPTGTSDSGERGTQSTVIHSTAREGAIIVQDKRGWVRNPLTQLFEHPLSSPEWWIQELHRQQRIAGR